MNLLEVKGISRTYGAGETAVHALNFDCYYCCIRYRFCCGGSICTGEAD